MEQPTVSSRTHISELLALSPLMAPLLIELRVDCIGCSMNRFCTLAALCSQYELNVDDVTERIQTRLAILAEK
jgi:hypothetical protein